MATNEPVEPSLAVLCQTELEKVLSKCSRLLDSDQSVEGQNLLGKCRQQLKKLPVLTVDNPVETSGSVLNDWLQHFTKALLDLTYYEENILVERDFTREGDRQTMLDILDHLEVSLTLAITVGGKTSIVLSEEVMECLRWRQGALCYMYCATLAGNDDWKDTLRNEFSTTAQAGVKYLGQMLATRQRLSDESHDEIRTNCEQVLSLVTKGIYSDTHALAVMYRGELCYWLLELLTADSDSGKRKEYCQVGRENLQLYIDLVNGPLIGWNANRAKELLKAFL